MASFPHRAAVALRQALGSDEEAQWRLMRLVEAIDVPGKAAEAELVMAVAEGEVEEDSEMERRLLGVLSKRQGVNGLLDGL